MKLNKLYIAYGSNLNMGQMAKRCQDAVPVGTAVIRGYKLMFRGSGSGNYLTIEPEKGRTVPVVLWSVSEKDEKNLDRYEGFPTFYYKKDFKLTMHDLQGNKAGRVDAFAYIMADLSDGLPRPAGPCTDYYYETCAEGYHRFGFNEYYLRKAYSESGETKYLEPKKNRTHWDNWKVV